MALGASKISWISNKRPTRLARPTSSAFVWCLSGLCFGGDCYHPSVRSRLIQRIWLAARGASGCAGYTAPKHPTRAINRHWVPFETNPFFRTHVDDPHPPHPSQRLRLHRYCRQAGPRVFSFLNVKILEGSWTSPGSGLSMMARLNCEQSSRNRCPSSLGVP